MTQKWSKLNPPVLVKVVTPTIFEFSILENLKIPEEVFSQTFMSFLVAVISMRLTLKLTFSSQTPDFARRGPLTSMLEESASHHNQC